MPVKPRETVSSEMASLETAGPPYKTAATMAAASTSPPAAAPPACAVGIAAAVTTVAGADVVGRPEALMRVELGRYVLIGTELGRYVLTGGMVTGTDVSEVWLLGTGV